MGIEVKTSMDVDRQGTVEGVGPSRDWPMPSHRPVDAILGPDPVSGGQVIAKVVAKIPANMADLPAQIASIRDELKQDKMRDRAQLFKDEIKKRLVQEGKLKIHQDVITPGPDRPELQRARLIS